MSRPLVCTKCGAEFPRRENGSGSQRKTCDACRAPKQYDHVCVVCETEFTSGKINQLTCSEDCYKIHDKAKTYAWRERNRERYLELCRRHNKTAYDKRKKPILATCEICGTEYEKRNRALTCSPKCSKELDRMRRRSA